VACTFIIEVILSLYLKPLKSSHDFYSQIGITDRLVDKNGFNSKMSSRWTGTIIKEHLVFASRITKRMSLVEQVLL